MNNINQIYKAMFTSYPDIVNIHQLKNMLGISLTLAYKLVRQNDIVALKIGREYKIPKENVISYLKDNLNNNTKVTNDKLFTKYLKEWLNSIKNTVEENTYDSYQIIVNKICEFFEPKKLYRNEVKPIHIEELYTHLYNKGLTGNTVLHYHSVLRNSLKTALELDLIISNPADRIERPKKEQHIGKFYSEAELKKLFKIVKNDPLNLVIYLTSFYGLRRSEVLGLKWDAFNFNEKTITINHKVIETRKGNKRVIILKDKTKNNSSYRTLPLVNEIIKLLENQKIKIEENKKKYGNKYSKKYLDYVCVNAKGKLFTPEYVTDHFALIMKKNKDILRPINFHGLRHSCASLLLAKGIHLKEIQDWLGHSTYATTANIYAHLEKNTKDKSAKVLSNTFTFKI